jgi:hypothetical protein
MTSFGMSDMFSRIMWGIIGAESLKCIRSVCGSLVWRVGLAKDAHSEALRALVAKERVHQPHPPFSRHRARKQIRKSTKYNTALCAPVLKHHCAVQTNYSSDLTDMGSDELIPDTRVLAIASHVRLTRTQRDRGFN